MTITKSSKTFRDITGIGINQNSQMKLFSVLVDNDRVTRFLNVFRAFIYNKDVQKDVAFFLTYPVGQDEWWDNISYKFYETPFLWWTIAAFNGVVNPFEELIPGTNIQILKPRYIYSLIRDMESMSGT
jgi:hypothetical protein